MPASMSDSASVVGHAPGASLVAALRADTGPLVSGSGGTGRLGAERPGSSAGRPPAPRSRAHVQRASRRTSIGEPAPPTSRPAPGADCSRWPGDRPLRWSDDGQRGAPGHRSRAAAGAAWRRSRVGRSDVAAATGRSRPGTGQPHRRAHGLQRRLRPAGRHRPGDRHRASSPRRMGGHRHPGRDRVDRDRSTSLDVGTPRADWTDYVAGTAREMSRAGLRCRGVPGPAREHAARGRRAVIVGCAGAGLGLGDVAGRRARVRQPLEVARIAQRAENEYVGMMCGLMDQFASACGVAGAAVMLDCRTLDHRPVVAAGRAASSASSTRACPGRSSRPPTTSGGLTASGRWPPCGSRSRTSARCAMSTWPMLERSRRQHGRGRRDACPPHHRGERPGAPDHGRGPCCRRRGGGRRAVRGQSRVAAGPVRGQLSGAGPAGGASLSATPGVVAARMTGAGFGGCIVALARPDAVDALWAAHRARLSRSRTGRTPRLWQVRAVAGAGELGA